MFFKTAYKKLQVLYLLVYLTSVTSPLLSPSRTPLQPHWSLCCPWPPGMFPFRTLALTIPPAQHLSLLCTRCPLLIPPISSSNEAYTFALFKIAAAPPKQLTLQIPLSLPYSFFLHNTYYLQTFQTIYLFFYFPVCLFHYWIYTYIMYPKPLENHLLHSKQSKNNYFD